MLRILLTAAALAAAATLAPRPASAYTYGHAPWCAVMNVGWETMASDCSFWTFEACVPYVIAGNRGFCEPNPDFRGPVKRGHRRHYRHRARP